MALGRNISPGQGETYYRKDDYYLEREGGEEHKLEWGGSLAEQFGLTGKADAETWKEALNGRFPGDVVISGGSFRDETGERQRRAGTDFEFSAPKSVSIQTLVHGDKRLIKAHREAVSVAMAELEKQVGARRGHGGREWETTGKGLIGRVTHFTSREGDPHLHDHVVFLNVTKNRDGSYQAMTNDRMMHYQRLIQEVYHAELSARIRQMGYEIETGKHGEPQIKGYTREQIKHFSGRAAQIEAYIKEKWGVSWSAMSREERNDNRFMHEEAWNMTRKSKKVSELEGLQEKWRSEAKAVGAEKILPGKTNRAPSEKERLKIARESLKFAIEHHTERESAVKDGELIRTALQAGRGKVTSKDIDQAVKEQITSGELIRPKGDMPKQALVTSREALEREKRILRMEREGRGSVVPIMNPFQAEVAIQRKEVENGMKYSPEQKTAMMLFLTSDNRFIGVNGFAGTGKTTLWKPCIEIAKDAGYDVIGLSPQHSGKDALKDSFEIFKTSLGIDNVRTVQSWLTDREAGKSLNAKTIVILDEAGLSSMKTAESVMRRIEWAGARAPLSGDKLQYESVEAGPAFRLLQERGRMETAFVTEMQRQRNAPENVREAAQLSVADPMKALEKLKENLREIKTPSDRYKALSEEYLKSKDPKDTLVLTGTHEARRAVNEHVREVLDLQGKGREFRTFESDDYTRAQRKRIDTYEKGQDIRFSKNYRSLVVKSGEVGKVEKVLKDSGMVILKMEDSGRIVEMVPRKLSGKGHEIGSVESIELSRGDRIRMNGNALKNEGITNGMRGEVVDYGYKIGLKEIWALDLGSIPLLDERWTKDVALDPHRYVKVRFDNGKTADIRIDPGKTLEMTHGYAQTGHSAQGLGAGKVILDLPSNSQTVNRRSFYTNLTRAIKQVVAFTDDLKKLFGSVEREKDKSLAHEVYREA